LALREKFGARRANAITEKLKQGQAQSDDELTAVDMIHDLVGNESEAEESLPALGAYDDDWRTVSLVSRL
jgi:hypothetical protein